MPTLIIHGDDDRPPPLAIGEYSHALPVTHPEKLADWIVSF